MAHDVFISYSHKDKATADAICAKLEQNGIRCWYAPRDIGPGETWAAAIVRAIQDAPVLVLVFTDFANESVQVLREVNTAVDSNTIIIPYKMTETRPTGDMFYYLAVVHWLDAINETQEESIDQLASRVKAILESLPENQRQKPPKRETPPETRSGPPASQEPDDRPVIPPVPPHVPRRWLKKLAIAAGALAVVAAGLVTWQMLGRQAEVPAQSVSGAGGKDVVCVYRDFDDADNHFDQKARIFGADESLVREMNEDCSDAPHGGRTCIRCEQVTRSGDWGGWLFLSGYKQPGDPAPILNDGSTEGQGLDLTGMSRLTFWARGAKGGETVEFFTCGFGYDEWNNPVVDHPDSAVKHSLGYITLGNQWQQFSIDLSSADLSSIGCGFGYVLSGEKSGDAENVFYLDDICFVS